MKKIFNALRWIGMFAVMGVMSFWGLIVGAVLCKPNEVTVVNKNNKNNKNNK